MTVDANAQRAAVDTARQIIERHGRKMGMRDSERALLLDQLLAAADTLAMVAAAKGVRV